MKINAFLHLLYYCTSGTLAVFGAETNLPVDCVGGSVMSALQCCTVVGSTVPLVCTVRGSKGRVEGSVAGVCIDT